MPKKPEIIHSIDKDLQEEIEKAYTKKHMTIADITKQFQDRLSANRFTARYRVKKLLEYRGVYTEPA